ncbi:15946_t:CDS:2 [Acaulospora morrowiae]|uniref:15946_t:CDS:1 n=1 Tax=Acaulospora morrowiae TaxID=94023 RepID=A0A9N9C1J0_9GLOM|nr:15946_t:CDS:2 [Acaulospora morrowiae]
MDVFKFFPKILSLPKTFNPFGSYQVTVNKSWEKRKYIYSSIGSSFESNISSYISNYDDLLLIDDFSSSAISVDSSRPTFSKPRRPSRRNNHIHSLCDLYCYQTVWELITSPQLKNLSEADPEYTKIKNDFMSYMRHVKVISIIRIRLSKERTMRYLNLRKEMARSCLKEGKIGRTRYDSTYFGDITRRVYHGTRATCDPDRVLQRGCCKDKRCGMCGIIQYGIKSKFSKFGRKMWFSKKPSIASIFSFNKTNSREYFSTMFIVDVLEINSDDSDVMFATLPRFLILYEH